MVFLKALIVLNAHLTVFNTTDQLLLETFLATSMVFSLVSLLPRS